MSLRPLITPNEERPVFRGIRVSSANPSRESIGETSPSYSLRTSDLKLKFV